VHAGSLKSGLGRQNKKTRMPTKTKIKIPHRTLIIFFPDIAFLVIFHSGSQGRSLAPV